MSLPSGWNELLVSLSIADNIKYAYSIWITKGQYNKGINYYYAGAKFSANSYFGGRIDVVDSKISIGMSVKDGTNYLASAVMYVLYR